MTRYLALVGAGKREEPVEVQPLGPGLYEVRLRGTLRRVDAFRHDSGTVSLLVDTASYSVQLDEAGSVLKVKIADSVFPVEMLDERRLRVRRPPARLGARGRQTLFSPIPGRVLRILKKVGDPVGEGEGVVVFEAMDMENEVRSPKAGKLVEMCVAEGEAVEGGVKLASVE